MADRPSEAPARPHEATAARPLEATAARPLEATAARPLNATAASLLGFLHEGPKTGWDLVVTAQERIGKFWSITTSQVYRELAAMERAGLVEAGEVGPRDRKPFALTGAGRAAFAEWIEREPGPENIRYPLLLTVAFGRHLPPGRLAEMLAVHRVAHERRLADYERAAAECGADPYSSATLDFGIVYERAVLEWFDRVEGSLGGGLVNPDAV
ncbi:DNA-binding PadR family transcriptional regulator [Rhodococcus ruber]|uniref:PadR family transcriptional regulator n=1 Tax=Rhodococcus TaxID=1827 RepID=UPI00029ACFB1|nr:MULTISPECIES: PadR family transcriptional regulator [Rhodococcus]MBP2212909.1 DNA-binding PadR family transcriptional regulator [Rhodococcus ruber]